MKKTYYISGFQFHKQGKKVQLSTSTLWRHTGGSRCTASLIANPSTRWSPSCPGSFTPRKNSRTNWTQRWVGPKIILDVQEKRKFSRPSWGSNPAPPKLQPIPGVHKCLKKSKSHWKILDTRRVIWSKIYNEDPQMLGAAMQNLVVMFTWQLGFVQPVAYWLHYPVSFSLRSGSVYFFAGNLPCHCHPHISSGQYWLTRRNKCLEPHREIKCIYFLWRNTPLISIWAVNSRIMWSTGKITSE